MTSIATVLRNCSRFVLPAAFLLMIPVCISFAQLMPAGQQPDEVAHIIRADSLLHGELLGHRIPRVDGRSPFSAGVDANWGLVVAGFTFDGDLPMPRKITAAVAGRVDALPWANGLTFVQVPNTAVYFPLFYAPAAFGIGLAHVAGLGPHDAILVGRMANVLVYAVLGLTALLLAERGNLAIFAALTLPMSISLVGSVGLDSMLVGTAALSAAALTRTASDRRWSRPLAGIGIAVIIATKLPYFPLALCAFASLPLRGCTLKQVMRASAETVAIVVPGLVWTAIAVTLVSVPFEAPPYHPGPLWPGDPNVLFQMTDMGAQLSVLFHHPSLLVTLPIHTIFAYWRNYLESMIGVMGLLNMPLPAWSYGLWEWALVAAAAVEGFRPRDKVRGVRGTGAALIAAGIIASIFAISLAQYLSWTNVGDRLIEGIQGRYFLPLLPFTGLLVPPLANARTASIGWLMTVPVVAAAITGIVVLPGLIVATFFLH